MGICKFQPHKIDTHEPIDKKVGTVDYVHERTPYTKFGTNTPTGCFWAKYNKNYFFYLCIPFFSLTYGGQTCWWIFTRDSSKDV